LYESDGFVHQKISIAMPENHANFRRMNPLKYIAPAAAIIGISLPGAAEPIAEGAALPVVACPDQTGKEVKLNQTGAKGYVLVYFYPKADTPGCTKQACSLRDAYEKITDKGVQVFGVSLDSVDAQKAFADKHKLPFTLLADKEGKVADAFGVPHVAGFAKRQAFLFLDGKLVWRDLSASTDQQAADVLQAIEKK
jgi:thioredoxin-dependent peroxiredoxin